MGKRGLESWGLMAAAMISGVGLTFSRQLRVFWLDRERSCRTAGRTLVALGTGMVVGIAAVERLPPPPAFGFLPQSVVAISGRLSSDPRRLESGSSLVSLDLNLAEDSSGRRADASGRLSAFIPEAAAEAIHAKGKGSVIALRGTVAQGRAGAIFRARSAVMLKDPNAIERRRNAALAAAIRRFRRVSWGGLAAALLLGVRDGLDEGEGELYAKSGCAHVLSLSGMHLAVISALVALALKRPLGFRAAAVVGTLFVSVYVLFVGFQPALVRSVIMYAFGATALLGGYPRRVLPLLAAAFLVQLSLDVESARGLSFVLSYLALVGIATLGNAADDLGGGILPGPLRVSLSTSIGAFLATAAVSAGAFGSLHPIGILSGLIVAPAATALMIGGLAWFALDILAAPITAAVEPLVGIAAKASGWTVESSARVSGLESISYIPVLFASLAAASLLVYVRYRLNETRNRVDPFD